LNEYLHDVLSTQHTGYAREDTQDNKDKYQATMSMTDPQSTLAMPWHNSLVRDSIGQDE
jgi:hypothetical protein